MALTAPSMPCPFCEHDNAPADLTCAGCGSPLTVNVAVTRPVEQEKAGALAEMIAEGNLILALRIEARLVAGRGVVKRSISAADAQWLIEKANQLGARLEIRRWRVLSSSKKLPPPKWRNRPIAGLVALLLLAVLLFSLSYLYRVATRRPADAGIGWRSATVEPGRIMEPLGGSVNAFRPSAPSTDAGRALTQEAIARARDAVVRISVPNGVGSGFFIHEDGLIVTNYHVIQMGGDIRISSGATEAEAKVIRAAPSWDLALLKVPFKPKRVLELADGALSQPTMPVFTVGSSEGLDGSVRSGRISYVGRPLGAVALLEIDMAAAQGNSGGPLLDNDGKVVGIVNAILASSERTSFAILSNYLFDGSDALLRGHVPRLAVSERFLELQLRSLADVGPVTPDDRKVTLSQAFVTADRRLAVLAEALSSERITRGEAVEAEFWVRDGNGNILLNHRVEARSSNAPAAGVGPKDQHSAVYFTYMLEPDEYERIIDASQVRVAVRAPELDLHKILPIEPKTH